MKSGSTKLFPSLLAIIMVFGLLLAMPLTAYADNATKLAETINDFKPGGTGKLAASASGNIVTVTGTSTGATNGLLLDIDSGVTVVWNAYYQGLVNPLVSLRGSGVFEVAHGSAGNSRAGSDLNQSVVDKDPTGAVVKQGVVDKDPVGAVAVAAQGGSLINNGNGFTIDANQTVKVIVSGGTVSGGKAINANDAGPSITVSSGTVESTGNNVAISAGGKIEISGGIVSGVGDVATISSPSAIVISGGTVKNTGSGVAIHSVGSGASVTISGGTVESSSFGQTIRAGNIRISGGVVKNTGANQAVTVSEGNLDISGGTVCSTTRSAIQLTGVKSSVNVSGGFVFAYGADIKGNVISSDSATNTITIGGNGVVCAWNQGAKRMVYNERTTDDLASSPTDAVKWGKSGSQSGINYANGSNNGFFPIDGVTVNALQSQDATTTTVTTASESISITLDGKKVTTETPPYVDANDRTMVPVRFISEALGADVKWNNDTNSATITKGATVIKLTIGSNLIIKNGLATTMDTVAVLKDDRTFVPVRFIAEALGLKVSWDGATNTVILTS